MQRALQSAGRPATVRLLGRQTPFRLAQSATKYSEALIEHFENPKNIGSLDKNSPNVGTAVTGAPACGDVMKFQIEVDGQGKVVNSKFKTFGCGSAIASSSVASEWVKGRTLDECLTIQNKDIAKHLNLPPVKLHCSMLAEEGIKAAIKDLQKKQGQEQKQM